MTEFHVEVVRVGKIEPHPNADSLSLTTVHSGYPVIIRTGDFAEGDLAVYVPVDAVCPDRPEWEFLGPGLRNHRIKARRLRGIFSMGLLHKAPDGANEGDDVAEVLGMRRYEDVVDEQNQYRGASRTDGLEVPAPRLARLPGVYDIEGYRKYGASMFGPDVEVVVHEKIHGQNFRAVHDGERLHVGSRTRWLSTDPETNTWAKVAQRYGLAEKLAHVPGLVVYGESYGNNADMPYGVRRAEAGDALAVFDVYDSTMGRWLNHNAVEAFCVEFGLPHVPRLARGRFGDLESSLLAMAEGKSTIPGADHVREGWVIKPTLERWDQRIGRVVLKLHGEAFLTRKEGRPSRGVREAKGEAA